MKIQNLRIRLADPPREPLPPGAAELIGFADFDVTGDGLRFRLAEWRLLKLANGRFAVGSPARRRETRCVACDLRTLRVATYCHRCGAKQPAHAPIHTRGRGRKLEFFDELVSVGDFATYREMADAIYDAYLIAFREGASVDFEASARAERESVEAMAWGAIP